MRRLTVLSIAFPFAPVTADPVGGAEQVLSHLDRALLAGGHRSIVIAAEGSKPAGELIAIPQPRGEIGQDEWACAHEYLRHVIPEVLRTRRVDLLHMHGLDYHSYLPPPGVPVLATLHMSAAFYAPEALAPERPRTWINTVSRHQQELLAVRSSRHVGAIENGVPLGPVDNRRRKRAYALAVGRICPEKGFHLAIDAAKLAGLPLGLIGHVFSYSQHQQYFDREIRPRLDRRRRWLGPVSGLRKWRLLRSARCLLVPSLVPETASLVAREALAAGTPVVAFPNGALSEVVDPGRTGFLVRGVREMAAAMLQAADIDPQACREAARERFSVGRMAEEYFALYDRLLRVA
ncbi:MAG TPA: glycosyltransferase [Pseudolabrys sp.]|jgi:glycosyltransferase involved in cell wall biosynthesis|nr:glycosyltransferase [Pseudolabrys sp.]